MSVCMGQAGMQSGFQAMAGDVSEGQRYLHLVQACMDASMPLYTVSETAFNTFCPSYTASESENPLAGFFRGGDVQILM
jgi:hypothetical protein